MKSNKSFDWTQEFQQVSTKEEFDKLDGHFYIHDNNHPISFEKKEYIPIPIREVV